MSSAIVASGTTYYLGDNGADVTDVAAGGVLVICAPTSTATIQQFFAKNRLFRITGAGLLDLTALRATTNLNVASALTNFSAHSAGQWATFAVRFNSGGVDADQQLLLGTLRGPLLEPSIYSVQAVGSGALTSDAAAAINLMSNSAGARPVTSPTLAIAYFNAYPTMQELMRTRDELLTRGRRPLLPSSVARAWRFGQGTGTVYDLQKQQTAIPTNGTPVAVQGPRLIMGGALGDWYGLPPAFETTPPVAAGGPSRLDRRRRVFATLRGLGILR